MAKAVLPAGYDVPESDQPIEIDLKEPWIAALLAWLMPGMGHVYQGRTGKGILFFVCVFGTFVFGMTLGEGKVVYASMPGQEPWRWQYYCQLGVGLPAMPALVQRRLMSQDKQPLLNGFMAPPLDTPQPWKDDSGHASKQPNELALWTVAMHPRFEIGTVYTVIAGLLNVLVICDAYAGPLVLLPKRKDDGGGG
jgi:TM2 domain-containing membrane protein YozV